MKLKPFFTLFILTTSLLVSCGDALPFDMINLDKAGEDYISKPVADTFHISSETVNINNTFSKPDSVFLLGKYFDKIYGGTSADLITQFRFKSDYAYMNSAVAETFADSTVLSLGFDAGAYFGDTLSSIEFKVYELKQGLKKDVNYYTNINTADYVDFSKEIGQLTQNIHQCSYVSKYGKYYVNIKLSDEFTSRFFNTSSSIFANQENFNSFFEGLYITTTQNDGNQSGNSSALIKMSDIHLNLFCHYKYKSDGTVFNMPALDYPVTSEVLSINRIQHPQKNTTLFSNTDTTYVCSPANMYTHLKIPIGRMRDAIKVNPGKELVVNSAMIKLNVVNKDTMLVLSPKNIIGTDLPYVTNLLLIKGSLDDVDQFFKNKSTEDNVSSFLSQITSTGTSTTGYKYSYTFSGLSTLIKSALEDKNSTSQYLDMYLVPVRKIYDSTGSTYINLAPASQMQAVGFYSGKNKTIPLKMELVYSTF